MSTNLNTQIAKIDIGDALHLVDNLPDGTMKTLCYDWRISPITYFGGTFGFPLTLLSVMFDTGSVLSGSRALEYFVPGSTGPDSDWDFYVPGYKESVSDMASVLSRCGVTWNLETERIKAALHEHGTVRVSGRVLECLSSWVAHLTTETAVALVGKHICDIISAYKLAGRRCEDLEYLVTLDSAKIELHDIAIEGTGNAHPNALESYEDPLGRSFSILHGQIYTRGGTQKVQLIIGRCYGGIRSCTSFIKSFYASHVQCFLSGWCASHLYYRQALAKNATLWKRSSDQREEKIQGAVKKYQERGYTFTLATAPSRPSIRNLGDEDAIFVDYGHVYDSRLDPDQRTLLSLWLEERRKDADTLYWTDLEGRVSVFRSEDVSLVGRRKTFAAGTGLPWCYLARLADLIACGPDTPEDIKDPSFRSAVSRSLGGEYFELRSAAKSGTVYGDLPDATPWSWVL